VGMSDSGRQGLASLEPRHGRDTTSWHLVNKPSQPGRQTVREPSPSHLSNATIPTQRLKCAIRRIKRADRGTSGSSYIGQREVRLSPIE